MSHLLSRVSWSRNLRNIFGESRTDVAEDTSETIAEPIRWTRCTRRTSEWSLVNSSQIRKYTKIHTVHTNVIMHATYKVVQITEMEEEDNLMCANVGLKR